MRAVLVSHPHAAAVAVGVARAFERSGRLARFWTGIAAARQSRPGAVLELASRWFPRASNRIVDDIVPAHVRAQASVELSARLLALVGPRSSRARRTYDTLFRLHDAGVAAMPWPRGVDCVYAYEDAAQRTFARATTIRAAKVLDLPAPHAAAQGRVWSEEAARWPEAVTSGFAPEPRWKLERKEAELAAADVLCVASEYTRSTLAEAGVSKPIVVAPYGFPLGRFTPRDAAPDGPFTVVAVGSQDLRKGTPYLLEAWRRASLRDARLVLVGPMRLADAFVTRYAGLLHHVPHMPRSELGSLYRGADLLAFPTLGDGFGLVILEAMCCGVPVLTTPHSGGPECLDDGVEGWLVPPRDVDALVERLRWAAAHRDKVAEMGRAARRRAEGYDERAAGVRLVRGIELALGGGSQGASYLPRTVS